MIFIAADGFARYRDLERPGLPGKQGGTAEFTPSSLVEEGVLFF